MQEKVIKIKNCKLCNCKFKITDNDLQFYKKVSPKIAGIKYEIPTPTFCPDCREQRRLSFRNERKLYKRKCDATGKMIVSTYSPNKKYKVYENDYWWSDKWNPIDYGLKYDFNKTFFEQFNNLLNSVPKINLYLQKSENSPYSNFESEVKDCYLTVGGHWNENNCYVTYGLNSKNCIDNYWLFNSDNSYENIICSNIHKCFYLRYSSDCQKCYFGYDLKLCENCIGCVGLRNKKYYIFNKKYSKEEYFKKIKNINFSNLQDVKKIKEEFNKIYYKIPHKNLNIGNSENCEGDDIFNSKNCINCFAMEDGENCKNSFVVGMSKNSMDCSSVGKVEKSYEFSSGGMNAYENLFAQFSYECQNVIYVDNCHYCSNLFGCVGLRNKQYCIFNKQYTKKEYENIVPKIIEHMKKTEEWGEFFPSPISPFGYNETVAQEYFPLTKEETIKLGLNWSDYEIPFPKVEKIIPANKLPNNINDIPDDILNWAIECEITNKPFKIIKQELDYYRKHNLPIPKRHPDQRHLDRMTIRNPRKLFDRKCNKCSIDMKTTYSPEREEIIYCEGCYNKEVY